MNAKITIFAAKQNTVLRGHPWIFPKAIKRTEGKIVTGDLVTIYNETQEFIGVGIFNEFSLYRVRVLALASESIALMSLNALIAHRLRQAKLVRECLNLPNKETTAYRLFNSEVDGLSGITIDRFNNICVLASSAYWVELHKERVLQELQKLFPSDELIWLPQTKPLTQDGWKHQSEQPIVSYTQIYEAGVLYEVEFGKAQKTGLFLDQRENHQRIAQLSPGKSVLDLHCYTGGFALHAAKAGASRVTAVDSSAQAIVQGRKNAILNEVPQIEFIEADARNYLVQAGEYDLVILDPPKLVPSQQHLQRAKNYYRFLHRELFKQMKEGSLLMTCNCSAALSACEFCSLVSTQASFVGKQARILGVYGPASCHPTLAYFPEGSYLTAVLLAVVS